jgi:hypothetical protein
MILHGCLAQRLGSGIDIDPATGRILTTLPDGWVDPPYRQGWRL